MPRERQPTVKPEAMANGETRSSNNGPGSVPPRNQSRGQQNFPNQGTQPPGEDVGDLFSPVSESSNVPPGMFDEAVGRMTSQEMPPMSPFSVGSRPSMPNMYPGHPKQPPNMPPMHPQMGLGHSRIYPPNQPMVFNPSNPNAPPIYPCGVCHKEIHDSDQAILCESGCNFWFHRTCTGLTDVAYMMLTKEVYAEWVCDKCLNTRSIPLVKMKP